MISGEDFFVLSTGTVCKVIWNRPEVGVDITQEEQELLMKKFADTWLQILTEDCNRLLEMGETELAERRWNDTGICKFPHSLEKNSAINNLVL